MKRQRGHLRIGTSGFQYAHWRGVFYPKGIPRKRWFDHYAQHFDTVEINNTFYRLPEAHTFDVWREQAPPGFLYTLKFSRYGSHVKRLRDPRGPIEKFVERATRLQNFLGPILVQLPPRWKMNIERLAAFLEAVPSGYRWVVEFRDPSWLCDASYRVLEKHAAALCIHDMIVDHPVRITVDWVYLRFHGDHYASGYSDDFLRAQAIRIQHYLCKGLDVYAYFNNDAEGYAVRNALDLKRHVAGG